MNSLIFFLFSLKVAFCSCQFEKKRGGFRGARAHYRVERVGQMPPAVSENSGLAVRPGRGSFWTHNDSGGKPMLYEVAASGKLLDSLPVPQAVNTDWEALAARDSTVLFVGDIGNNRNDRPTLTVYRVEVPSRTTTGVIRVRFARQTRFPAAKDTRNFDSEALVYARDSLFLVSKNRSRPRRPAQLYGFPATAGLHAIAPLDSVWTRSMVTDAALSPDARTLALLTYGKLLLFDLPDGRVSLRHPRHCLRVPRGQTEALAFVGNTELVMTNERGAIYRIRPATNQRKTGR